MAVDGDAVTATVREHLAGYKVPRHVLVVEEIPRLPNGKPDFETARAVLADALTRTDA
jgi:fatty-acyl-CoA synthase